ncbi:hypothetical protein ABKN59_001341 [Abortiporus biennis]
MRMHTGCGFPKASPERCIALWKEGVDSNDPYFQRASSRQGIPPTYLTARSLSCIANAYWDMRNPNSDDNNDNADENFFDWDTDILFNAAFCAMECAQLGLVSMHVRQITSGVDDYMRWCSACSVEGALLACMFGATHKPLFEAVALSAKRLKEEKE